MGTTSCKGPYKHRCVIARCNERHVTGKNVKKTPWSTPWDLIDEMLTKATDQAIEHSNQTDGIDRLTDTKLTQQTTPNQCMQLICFRAAKAGAHPLTKLEWSHLFLHWEKGEKCWLGVRSWLMTPGVSSRKLKAHFIFEKMEFARWSLNFQQKRRVSKTVCTFRHALQWASCRGCPGSTW